MRKKHNLVALLSKPCPESPPLSWKFRDDFLEAMYLSDVRIAVKDRYDPGRNDDLHILACF